MNRIKQFILLGGFVANMNGCVSPPNPQNDGNPFEQGIITLSMGELGDTDIVDTHRADLSCTGFDSFVAEKQ